MAFQIICGLITCALHITTLQLAINTWGFGFFNLGVFPEWAAVAAAKGINASLAVNGTDDFAMDMFTTAAHAFGNSTLAAVLI